MNFTVIHTIEFLIKNWIMTKFKAFNARQIEILNHIKWICRDMRNNIHFRYNFHRNAMTQTHSFDWNTTDSYRLMRQMRWGGRTFCVYSQCLAWNETTCNGMPRLEMWNNWQTAFGTSARVCIVLCCGFLYHRTIVPNGYDLSARTWIIWPFIFASVAKRFFEEKELKKRKKLNEEKNKLNTTTKKRQWRKKLDKMKVRHKIETWKMTWW